MADEGYTYAKDALRNCFCGPGVLDDDFKAVYSDLREIIACWDIDQLHENINSFQTLRLRCHPHYNRLLANCFLDGYGVPENEEQGFLIYQYMHNEFNNTELRYALCFLYGQGTETDYGKGFSLLNKIYEGESFGKAKVAYYLGLCYAHGWGTEVDYRKSLSLFEESAKGGYSKAYYDLGVIYRNGEGVVVDMNKSIAYYQEGLDAGVADCAMNLGIIYARGINGVPQDINRAKQIYLKGIDLGSSDCMFNLAVMYLNGLFSGGRPDYPEAVRYFKMAVDEGEPDSMYHLGLCYLNGHGVEKNPSVATNLIVAAARNGIEDAQELLKENNISWED